MKCVYACCRLVSCVIMCAVSSCEAQCEGPEMPTPPERTPWDPREIPHVRVSRGGVRGSVEAPPPGLCMGDMHMECALATRACPRDLSSLRADTTPADPLRAITRGVPSCLGVFSRGAINGLTPPAPAAGTDAGFGSPSPEARVADETVDDEVFCRSRAESVASKHC